MDSPGWRYDIAVPKRSCCINSRLTQEEFELDATTVGVDLAKSRYELAVADGEYRIRQRARLTRTLTAHGHRVQLLPAR
jgi:hypothetical protein